ncbi:MAG: hypothetical protein V3U65_10790 [Granulosicoccaceae bacterium]
MDIETISSLAATHGLSLRGGFAVSNDDRVPTPESGAVAQSLVLFGNTGSAIWPTFSSCPEIKDGLDNPLDRWSKRIGDDLAAQLGGVAYYPFAGPPHQPFISWAQKAEALRPSKLGMLLHPEFGLWHAYRFALALPYDLFDKQTNNLQQRHACDTCKDQPCYSACPVEAFVNGHYDVNRCVRYLDANPQGTCNHSGCMARMSCVEAEQHRYLQPHAEFHINQFLKARLKVLSDIPDSGPSNVS